LAEPKIAFVQDWLVDYGGAERCLELLCTLFPAAPVHTLFYDPGQFENSVIGDRIIHTTFLNRPLFRRRYRTFLALFPFAVEQLDLDEAEVVLSFSHSVAHGALVRSDALHLCYCHTPMRYAWDLYKPYLRLSGLTTGVRSWAARAALHYIRQWDALAGRRVDVYAANSRNVARRIRRIYDKEATVIYPPVEVERFSPAERRSESFLVVGRMVPYKRTDLAVVACTRLGLPLRVVGDGPEMERLKRLAGPTVSFLGRLPDAAVAEEMAQARALLFCGEEDFGIAPVEAQAAGTPVIAYARGGALETVVPPEGADFGAATGLFFAEPSTESLAQAMADFDRKQHLFQTSAMTANAARFNADRYVREMKEFVVTRYEAFRGGA
jgi:glycosyltransferase involved in cell wall biosynthesis